MARRATDQPISTGEGWALSAAILFALLSFAWPPIWLVSGLLVLGVWIAAGLAAVRATAERKQKAANERAKGDAARAAEDPASRERSARQAAEKVAAEDAGREAYTQAEHTKPPPRPKPTERAKTPHEVLGVPQGASSDEIRAAYKRLVQQYHPDRVNSLGPEFRDLAEVKMRQINAAYELLRHGA